MIIVTNATPTGNYTPSVFLDKNNAENWIKECTANNIRGYKTKETEGMDDDEVIEWSKKHFSKYCFVFCENKSYIEYSDGSYNLMELFEVEAPSPKIEQ